MLAFIQVSTDLNCTEVRISHESAVESKKKMVVGKSYDLIRMFPVIIKTCGRDGYTSS